MLKNWQPTLNTNNLIDTLESLDSTLTKITMGKNDVVLVSAGVAAVAGILGFVLHKRYLSGDKYDGLDSVISFSSRKIAGDCRNLWVVAFKTQTDLIFRSSANCYLTATFTINAVSDTELSISTLALQLLVRWKQKRKLLWF